MLTGARHQCMIYDGSPSRTLSALASVLRGNLEAGRRCMYLNSPAMVAGLRSQLYASGVNVEREQTRGALVLESGTAHLVDGRFDIDRLIQRLDDAVDDALAHGFTGLFATGDMTWEFGPEKDFSKLVDYEWGLELLFRKHPALSGICQYHRDLLPKQAVREGIVSHEGVFISAMLSQLNPFYVRAHSVAERKAAVHPELDASLGALLALTTSTASDRE